MDDKNTLIHEISKKVDSLLAQNKKLREENRVVSSDRERLLKDKISNKERIERLEQELRVLKFREDIVGAFGDKDRAKRKLRSILREIDQCIELINK